MIPGRATQVSAECMGKQRDKHYLYLLYLIPKWLTIPYSIAKTKIVAMHLSRQIGRIRTMYLRLVGWCTIIYVLRNGAYQGCDLLLHFVLLFCLCLNLCNVLLAETDRFICVEIKTSIACFIVIDYCIIRHHPNILLCFQLGLLICILNF